MKSRNPLVASLAMTVVIVGLGMPIQAASGQSVFVSTTSGSGPGGNSQISRQSLDRYFELLQLDAAQRDMARTLHEGYTEAFQTAIRERREASTALMRSMEEHGDRTAIQEKMPEITQKYRERTSAIEKSFLGDLKALLSDQQAGHWPAVERLRRRETGLGRGGLAGESVDLTDIVRAMSVNAEGLSATLQQYELDLDRALQDRAAAMADAPAFRQGPIDIDSMQELMGRNRELGLRIRDLNQSYARRIESLLAEGERPQFAREVRRRSFPQVYRTPHTLRLLESAAGLGDLNEDQRRTITADKAAYERELAAVNEAWADAILAAEEEGDSGAVMGDGQMIRMRFGEEPQGLQDARRARRELDERFQDRLLGRLSKEQQARLPKREEGQMQLDGPVFGREAVIIRGGGG